MPDVPTMDEAGMPGFDVGIWIGLLAPSGTPADIVGRLSAAANDALKTDEVGSAMKSQTIDPIGSTPQEFADFIQKDQEKWSAPAEGHRSQQIDRRSQGEVPALNDRALRRAAPTRALSKRT
jgi:tripartite-type tricarboxylate transporter receptor subunit TctC